MVKLHSCGTKRWFSRVVRGQVLKSGRPETEYVYSTYQLFDPLDNLPEPLVEGEHQ